MLALNSLISSGLSVGTVRSRIGATEFVLFVSELQNEKRQIVSIVPKHYARRWNNEADATYPRGKGLHY
jgi:hypothetical protein